MKESEPEERKWFLITKFLTESLAPEEQLEFERLMKDTAFRNEFEQVKQYWNKMEGLPYFQLDKEKDWKAVMDRIRQQTTLRSRPDFSRTWRYAAVIAFFLVASVLIWKIVPDTSYPVVATIIEAPNGARTLVTLPDSSSLWLNAGSKVSYNQEFGITNRDIVLEGEAFFDVRKKNVPFTVQTTAYNITVLGTAFNVKAYHEDDLMSTTLLRGSLKVDRITASGIKEEFLLQPNEKLVLRGSPAQRNSEPMVLEKNIDAIAEADWKDGWLTVRGESLGDLAKKIERIYNVRIHFADEKLKTYRYNGRIQQFSLEQVLHALTLTSPIKFVIDEKSVTLSENELTKSKYQRQTP
jgi:ferric-dicitrate binding protein FerR (iron transport regulator)